jgi:phosphoglycerate kinase
VAEALESRLGAPVTFIEDATSENTSRITRRMQRGEVALVENTRFLPGEEANDPSVAETFAALGDFFVNDAFGAAHRAHASTAGVAALLSPAVAGILMTKELQYLGQALSEPRRPFVAVLGGAKISGKIDVIEALLPKTDAVLIGGAMASTFFVALGCDVGTSLVEPDKVSLAKKLLARGEGKIVLPHGARVAQEMSGAGEVREVARDAIPQGWGAYDIDTATSDSFSATIRDANTVVWNGPMGVFENPPFDQGTLAVARAMAHATSRGATTVVGGGDSAAAVAAAGLEHQITHVSTGGGASLEFLEGKPLPGITALDDA